jgi:hypothetical protein
MRDAGRSRTVKSSHGAFRLLGNGAGNGHTLLLIARLRREMVILVSASPTNAGASSADASAARISLYSLDRFLWL